MAQCRMITIYGKYQCLADYINKLQDPKYILTPLVEKGNKILEENQEFLAKNQLSQEKVAELLKLLQAMEVVFANLHCSLNEMKQLCFFLEKNLIFHYQSSI